MTITPTTPRSPRARPVLTRWWRAIALVVSLLLLASGSAPIIQAAPPARQPLAIQDGLSGPVIVLLSDDADSSRVIRESTAAQPRQVYSRAIRGFAADLSAAEVQRLARDPRVRAITPDSPVYAQAQTLPTGVDRIDADRNGIARIDGQDTPVNAGIAILDAGVDVDHPDLNVVGGTDCIGAGNYDDPVGHGTHVAGIAAARDNGFGTVGVAPGARLYSVKVLNSSLGGSLSNVICGLEWAIQNRAAVDVVNLSLAGFGNDGPCSSNLFHDAICKTVAAGITIVTAAGNYARDSATTIPATYPEVMAIAAFTDYNGRPGGGAPPICSENYGNPDDTFASYSNRGGDIAIVAPGTCILSTFPGGATGYKTGTSMASPHVAGAAALYLAANPGASPGAVRAYLVNQSQSQNGTYGITGDPDGSREPVLYVGSGIAPAPVATPRPTATPAAPAPTFASGDRPIRGGGSATSTPRPLPTATPRPGVTPPPATSAPPPSTGGRTIRGGSGGSAAPTSTPITSNPAPPPNPANPTATPGGSRSIRGSVAGASVSGDGTGGAAARSRVIRGAPTATPAATARPVTSTPRPAPTPTPTARPTMTATATATAIPPTPTSPAPTATSVPPTPTVPAPTATAMPPTATPTQPPAVVQSNPSETNTARVAVTSGDGANCRGEPTTEGSVLAVVPTGSLVTLNGESQGEWQPIICEGQTGFISIELLDTGTTVPTAGDAAPTTSETPAAAITAADSTSAEDPNEEVEVATATPEEPTPFPIVRSRWTDNSFQGVAAYDGNERTAWQTTIPEQGQEAAITFDLGAIQPVGSIDWLLIEPGMADGLSIQLSDDGERWMTITPLGNTTIDEWQTTQANVAARYVRFLFEYPVNAPSLVGLAEVEIMPADGNLRLFDPDPITPTPVPPTAIPATEAPAQEELDQTEPVADEQAATTEEGPEPTVPEPAAEPTSEDVE